MTPIRVFLVDDHRLFRAGLRMLLQTEPDLVVVGEAQTRSEALDLARTQPSIVLLDTHLGIDSGLDLLPELIDMAGEAHVIALQEVADPQISLRAMALGARGVVLKTESPDMLIKAIRRVHAGEAWLNRAMIMPAMLMARSRHQLKVDPEAMKISSLTAREREVVTAIGDGLRNKEIADRLDIAEKTVRHYLSSIFEKLHVTDRFALMIYAYQHGLAKVPVRPRVVSTVA